MKLDPGDRVEHMQTGDKGTVSKSDHLERWVIIEWDDGKEGILYEDTEANARDGVPFMIPNAKYLQRLRKMESA